MNSGITFSVIIPLYNKEQYILDALRGALAQTRKPDEIIVVDDGSTDGGLDLVVNNYENSIVTVISQDNMGVSAARNTGINSAKSNWCLFLDADDYWLPNHVEEIERQIVANTNIGMAANNHVKLFVGTKPPTPQKCGKITCIDYLLAASKRIGIVNSSCVAIKRSVFDELGGFRNYRLGEDLEMWTRISLHYLVSYSDLVTAVYYKGAKRDAHELSAMRPRLAQRKINCIEDVSPAIRTLCEAGRITDSSSQRYLRSVIKMMIRQDLVKGDVGRAKVLRKYLPGLSGMYLGFMYFLYLPDKIVLSVLWAGLSFRAKIRGRGDL